MINQLGKYIFLYAFIRPMDTYHYLNKGLCVVDPIAIMYEYVMYKYLIRALHYRLWLILALY